MVVKYQFCAQNMMWRITIHISERWYNLNSATLGTRELKSVRPGINTAKMKSILYHVTAYWSIIMRNGSLYVESKNHKTYVKGEAGKAKQWTQNF